LGADGRTRSDRNRAFGVSVPEIDFPDGFEYLWEIFWEVRLTCPMGFDAPQAMRPRDILDWQSVSGDVVSPDDYRTLLAMDQAYLEAWREEAENNAAIERAKTNG